MVADFEDNIKFHVYSFLVVQNLNYFVVLKITISSIIENNLSKRNVQI